MDRKILVIGGGGHGKVLIDTLHAMGLMVAGILDANPANRQMAILGVPILGEDTYLDQLNPANVWLVNALGSSKDTNLRTKTYQRLRARAFHFLQLRHPQSIVSSSAKLENGSQILAGAILQADSVIGENTIINTKVSIDHDCRIGAHCHIAPGVTLSGNVTVGDRTHIGTGAVVIQGVKIGSDCTIGAGSVVVRNIPDGALALGNPCRVKA